MARVRYWKVTLTAFIHSIRPDPAPLIWWYIFTYIHMYDQCSDNIFKCLAFERKNRSHKTSNKLKILVLWLLFVFFVFNFSILSTTWHHIKGAASGRIASYKSRYNESLKKLMACIKGLNVSDASRLINLLMKNFNCLLKMLNLYWF